MTAQIKIFYSYAHEDEQWRNELEKHLSNMERQEIISGWHDRKIIGGKEWAHEIATKINEADIILLLISPDFMVSQYCNEVEVPLAMERHKAGEASVIPIIIHPAKWKKASFARLQALPKDGKPISSWLNRDEAFLDVEEGIRRAIEEQRKKSSTARSKMTNNKSEGQKKATKSSQVWSIPFPRNPFFTDRENILDSLHNILTANNTAALKRPLALSGLEGAGKTQIALEYAYRYRGDYQYMFWVRCETDETIVSDLLNIAALLNLPKRNVNLPERNARVQDDVVKAVNRWLDMNTNWLLIFDGVEDLPMVGDYRRLSEAGHILLTTHRHAMSEIAQRVAVEKMEAEQGALFLLRRTSIIEPHAPLSVSSEVDCSKAKEISEAMDGLPLAIDQAGAFIEDTQCGLAGYLDLYRKRGTELLKQRGGIAASHPETVVTTWSLSFERVEKEYPAAAELLCLCAFFYPDAIPEEIITKGAPELGPVLQPVAADSIKFNMVIGELLRYSLVLRDPNSKTVSVHRLLQDVLRDRMDETTQRYWAERAVRAVKLAFPDVVEVSTWPICQRCLPHALVCAEHIQQWDMKFTEAAQLLNDVAYYLHNREFYAEAEPLYRQALKIYMRILGSVHPDVAATLDNFASLYNAQGKYREAELLCKWALKIDEKVLGLEHPKIAITLNNLAFLCRAQGKYGEAEQLYQRAVKIDEKVLGPNHPDLANHLNNLAGLYYAQGKYIDAEPLYHRAIEIGKQTLGLENSLVATYLSNLAELYNIQGKYVEAEPHYQRALRINEKVLGREHPALAIDLTNLALFYSAQGKYVEAEPFYQRALAIREKVLGPEHPDVAVSLNNLVGLYYVQEKYAEAEALYQHALKINEDILGPDHPSLPTLLENYAFLLRVINREAEAAELEVRAKAIQAKTLMKNSLDSSVL